jgi:hypothetical protein
MFFCEFQEPRKILIVIFVIELSLAGLVVVPHDVDAERVEAHGFDHEDTVLPVFLGDARVMDLACVDGQKGLQGRG